MNVYVTDMAVLDFSAGINCFSFACFLFSCQLSCSNLSVASSDRSEFIFINPNSKGQCGCGESFMTMANAGAAKSRND